MAFKIDGVEVFAPQVGETSAGREIIGPSTRTIDGTILSFTVAVMDKFIWDYKAIPAKELKKIEDIIEAKTTRIGLNTNSFEITHNNGYKDIVQTCYLGNSRYAVPIAAWDGKPTVFATRYSWIQIYGAIGDIIA